MKRKSLLMLCGIAVTALLTGCSGNSTGKSADDLKLANGSDSASYFYGQTMASRMVDMGQNDSIYKDKKMRDAYWEGIRKAFDMMRDGDAPEVRAYNEGLLFGMQIAQNMKATSEEIPEYKFNIKLFEEGYNYAFAGDSVRNPADAQFYLEKTMNAMNERAMAAKKKELDKDMSAYASKHGFKKEADGSYQKIVKQGNGPEITVGDSLTLSVEFATNKGRDMAQYKMQPSPAVLGKTLPMTYPYAKIINNMKSGTIVSIITTPEDLFGAAAKSFRFDKDEFIIVTLNPEFKAKTSFTLPDPSKNNNVNAAGVR